MLRPQENKSLSGPEHYSSIEEQIEQAGQAVEQADAEVARLAVLVTALEDASLLRMDLPMEESNLRARQQQIHALLSAEGFLLADGRTLDPSQAPRAQALQESIRVTENPSGVRYEGAAVKAAREARVRLNNLHEWQARLSLATAKNPTQAAEAASERARLTQLRRDMDLLESAGWREQAP